MDAMCGGGHVKKCPTFGRRGAQEVTGATFDAQECVFVRELETHGQTNEHGKNQGRSHHF